ncbi:hypothetical protein DRJ16_02215 [Candidatus Woesearchaeota archaeon]|nr:MAG: hypothetical protein DRJ16_02215 [Candidatus Woesearchaeota archaeon]
MLNKLKRQGGIMSELCKNCDNWKRFGKGCWFYWEGKRRCTQFVDSNTFKQRFADLDEDLNMLIEKARAVLNK